MNSIIKLDTRGRLVIPTEFREILNLKEGDDAADAKFFDVNQLPELSFDHDIILKDISRSV